MRPQHTSILPPTWPPSASPTPASAPVFRPPSTTRRKSRPRSPDPPSNSPPLSQPSSNVSPSTHVKPHPHSAVNPTNGPEPASSTAHHYTDDDLDMTTDIASDKDYADSHKPLQNSHKQTSAPLQKPADPSPHTSLLHPSPEVTQKKPDAKLPHRPIWFLDSDISSDEEEDYRENYRRFLRRRTAEDEAREKEVRDEVRRKRSRSGRRGKREENNLKKNAAMTTTFQTAEAQKNIRVTLTAAEMDQDLTRMFGLDEEVAALEGKKDGKGEKRKRIESGHNEEVGGGNKKRCHSPSKASKHKSKAVVTRAKVHAGKKVTTVVKAHAIKKKNSPVSVQAPGNVSKMFVKHKTKKGWSVCVYCGVEVWPPNCQKHVSGCHGLQKSE